MISAVATTSSSPEESSISAVTKTSSLDDDAFTTSSSSDEEADASKPKSESESPPLQQDKAEVFHTTVAQGLFLTRRGMPDIHTGIAFLCTRVQQPNEEDWEKLMRLMKYMNGKKIWC